ncbi:unnamed protein product [Rotaria magnacalcarata]|uniref:Uncharacterized protein n=1 Tax=Rotaria magnacalcarata TaxID=392030 RepID=A0A815AEM7_9BILA|nr:unnamed protein product [Rotaria magnacalcarata]CAF1638866.1 unnamed protein product [Rotaria magnacalcarata]CAF1948219.1 unnamed protein product [Rotaria magnacalcarata]CAF3833277.1 unnamed protein product [Rotaria magnacalcarata]CAF4892271.1 unnamed protein product [Rotaria magnacalcarata]
MPDNTGQNNIVMCLCTTNNCNVDLITCTNGMNIPSYLLGYSGSTASLPTTSTINTSSGTTVSSGSASSSSTSINTSLQSWASIPVQSQLPSLVLVLEIIVLSLLPQNQVF